MWNLREHSEDETLWWCWLRATEWGSWPAFLSKGIAPVALLFTSWKVVLGTVVALNILWAFTVRYRFVSLHAAEVGVFVGYLSWLTCPIAAYFIWSNDSRGPALLALLWPLVAAVLAPIPPLQVGVVQKQFLAKLGYVPADVARAAATLPTKAVAVGTRQVKCDVHDVDDGDGVG
jgi:hypothetical protein